jgi:hypothetical protein
MPDIVFTNPAPSPIGGAGAILTLDEYNTRRELTEASTERDEATSAAIAAAEDAVLQHTGRDFTQPAGAETRSYVYDGSGILEVDDFTNATAVTIDGAAQSGGWTAGPREGNTFYWIDFGGVRRESPEMGFMRNLDTLAARTGRYRSTVNVTAEFGWPGDAPASVKQAVVWLVDEMRKSTGNQGDVQAEAIADLNYVYQRINEHSSMPARVLALLEPFRRISL